jgi:molybdopterin molybdotransferase
MLSIDEALKLVLEYAKPLPAVATQMEEALGSVLAETIVSDVDSPPHDKSIVDGYAVIAADITEGAAELTVIEEVTAGAVPTKAVERGTATRIMTGAPVPRGADAVVMIEQTELRGSRVRINGVAMRSGQNIVRRASSLARGQTVLQPGKLVRPIEMGLLAEVGQATASMIPQPTVGVLVTGNELVGPSVVPGPGQIRNSNTYLLQGLVQQAGGRVSDLGIARDEAAELSRDIHAGLSRDVLILSGGVSAGVLDLVPKVLTDLGVTEVFHKVNLKPGKPMWFGHKRHGEGDSGLVFGLPGNPVSSLVCFELFVRPAIQKMRGLTPTGLKRAAARLSCDHQQRGDRPTYWPAVIESERVTPLTWKGSGDLRTLADANCLAFFPAGERVFGEGEQVEVLWLE